MIAKRRMTRQGRALNDHSGCRPHDRASASDDFSRLPDSHDERRVTIYPLNDTIRQRLPLRSDETTPSISPLDRQVQPHRPDRPSTLARASAAPPARTPSGGSSRRRTARREFVTPSGDTTASHLPPVVEPPRLAIPLHPRPWDSVVSAAAPPRQTDRMPTRRHRTTQPSARPLSRLHPRAGRPSTQDGPRSDHPGPATRAPRASSPSGPQGAPSSARETPPAAPAARPRTCPPRAA